MAEVRAREALHALVIAAVDRVQASGQRLETFRGIALYDTTKDEAFTSLEAFNAAETAITSLPLVEERYGVVETRRIALQFVYEFLDRVSEPVFEAGIFDALWDDFLAELDEPQWLFRGVANMQCLEAKGGPFDLGDGVSIRGRSFQELSELGFRQADLRGLSEDWSASGSAQALMSWLSRFDSTSPLRILSCRVLRLSS